MKLFVRKVDAKGRVTLDKALIDDYVIIEKKREGVYHVYRADLLRGFDVVPELPSEAVEET